MSRSYRIRVSETLRRVLRAHDKVSTCLEMLEVLPADQMGELLAKELEGRGFERKGDALVREEDGVVVSVDAKTATVTVSAEGAEKVELKRNREGHSWDEIGPGAKQVRKQLSEQAKEDLERDAAQQTEQLQSQITDRLEKHLADIRQELDQAVNRVTAEALKQKAAQMGQIKEITEDEQTGSLTIVVEV